MKILGEIFKPVANGMIHNIIISRCQLTIGSLFAIVFNDMRATSAQNIKHFNAVVCMQSPPIQMMAFQREKIGRNRDHFLEFVIGFDKGNVFMLQVVMRNFRFLHRNATPAFQSYYNNSQLNCQ